MVPLIDDARCANDFQARGDFVNGGTATVLQRLGDLGRVGHRALRRDPTSLDAQEHHRLPLDRQSRGIRDADNTPFLMITTDVGGKSTQFSQELQLQYHRGIVNGILGGYYYEEDTFERATVPLAFPPSPPVISSLLAGRPGVARPAAVRPRDPLARPRSASCSVEPVDGLELTGGLRYTEDRKTYQGTVMNLFPATSPDPDPLPTLAILEGAAVHLRRAVPGHFLAPHGLGQRALRVRRLAQRLRVLRDQLQVGRVQHPLATRPAAGVRPGPVRRGERRKLRDSAPRWTSATRASTSRAFQANYDDMQLIFRQGVVPLLFNAGKARIRRLRGGSELSPRLGLRLDAGPEPARRRYPLRNHGPGASATVAPGGDDLPHDPVGFQGNFGIG